MRLFFVALYRTEKDSDLFSFMYTGIYYLFNFTRHFMSCKGKGMTPFTTVKHMVGILHEEG